MGKSPDIAVVPPVAQETRDNLRDAPVRGRWYLIRKNAEDDTQDTDTVQEESFRRDVSEDDVLEVERSGGWVGCVTHIGSNYVEVKGPGNPGSIRNARIHFDNFWKRCEPIDNPDPIIDGKIRRYQEESRSLMEDVRALTAKLGVGEKLGITDQGSGEVKAISIRSSEPVEAYKKALIKAEKKTLPDLFEKIKASNQLMSTWMRVKILPLEAEAEALQETVGLVKDRIFSVELYAGLVEKVVRVRDGAPAGNDDQVHLMQRRAYMDEECLVGYETGGMDYKSIEEFDAWLCKPTNFMRLLPYPKTFIAFRVRRNKKDREFNSYSEYVQVLAEEQADKITYLYVRNGEQLHRIRTEIEFEAQLFPDTNNKIFTSSKLWASQFLHGKVEDLISDEEYQGKIEDYETEQVRLKKVPEKDQWKFRHIDDPRGEYQPFTQDNLYYDDIMEILENEKKKHNRLVLVMQGLLDRSPVLHPHPPWQLWTHEGLNAAFKLVYDATRALSAGDKPSFEEYRARLNSYLKTGSITVGQETPWMRREAERVNKERANDPNRHYSDREYTFYRPPGDPGPGKIAVVSRYSERERSCTYRWTREPRRCNNLDKPVGDTLTTGEEHVFNIDAYKPGDFHIFFDDPRTRLEYLCWAPLLLEAEECHAGNRPLKPNKSLPAISREPRAGSPRPVDLRHKEKPKQPPIEERYIGKKAILRRDMETRGHVKFKKGEIVLIDWYYRKKVSLSVGKRSISNVELYSIDIIGE